jgi:phage terminase large subunit
VAAEGAIYEEWSEAASLLAADHPIGTGWTRFMSVDFGFTNPFVAQWWAEDDDGRLYLYREIYETGRTVDQHAATIKRLSGTERMQAIICDHDAEGRAVLARELGRAVRPADKRVTVGLQAVQQRLRAADDGRPRLFVLRGARAHAPDPVLLDAKRPTSTLEEIPGYVWDVTEGRPPKEVPRKEDDHGCDAMRYMVMYRTRPAVRGARFI